MPGARWGSHGEPWALHRPGSRGWGVGFGGAVAPVQGGCSPGRGAEPCWPRGPLCLPRAGLRVLLVPQVKRLENVLKFGLWLFGVPWANSECCPHSVPVPAAAALGLPPLTALLSPPERLQAGVPLPALHGLSLLNPRLSLQEVGAATVPSPWCPPPVPRVPPLTPTPPRASCSLPRTCSTSPETSRCVGTCRPPRPCHRHRPAGSRGDLVPSRPPSCGTHWPHTLPGSPRRGLKPGVWPSLEWRVRGSRGAPATGSPRLGPIPGPGLGHSRVPRLPGAAGVGAPGPSAELLRRGWGRGWWLSGTGGDAGPLRPQQRLQPHGSFPRRPREGARVRGLPPRPARPGPALPRAPSAPRKGWGGGRGGG